MKWLNAMQINDVHPDQWLRQSTEPIKVTGEKFFTENLHFYDPFVVLGLVNGIDVHHLSNDVFRTVGDQVVTGHKTFTTVIANE